MEIDFSFGFKPLIFHIQIIIDDEVNTPIPDIFIFILDCYFPHIFKSIQFFHIFDPESLILILPVHIVNIDELEVSLVTQKRVDVTSKRV